VGRLAEIKMKMIEDIRNIFSILHDGIISAWSGDKELLVLTIYCEYLAEQMDSSFNKFYIELSGINKITLSPWTNSPGVPAIPVINLPDIFQAQLEILSADITNDLVIITCKQHDTRFDYSGANLAISCNVIKIFDQGHNELTIEELARAANAYWKE